MRRRLMHKATLGISLAVCLTGLVGWMTVGKPAAAPKTPAEIIQMGVEAGAGRDADKLDALRALAGNGNTLAQRTLGQALLVRNEPHGNREAIDWLQRAALGKDVEAATLLGRTLMQGVPGVARDDKRAFPVMLSAGRAGHGAAAYYLGVMLKNGYGTQVDALAAVRWFDFAAKQHSPYAPAAMFMLANAHRYGEGVKANEGNARILYLMSARMGYPAAIQTLAMAYQNGELGLERSEAAYQRELAEMNHVLKHPQLAL